jgi:hypothetical protein
MIIFFMVFALEISPHYKGEEKGALYLIPVRTVSSIVRSAKKAALGTIIS